MWILTYAIRGVIVTLSDDINTLNDIRAQVIAQGAANTLIDWVAS